MTNTLIGIAAIVGSMGPPGREPRAKQPYETFRHLGVVVIRAGGIGLPPRQMRAGQARLMARRAAEVRAVRNLATNLATPPGARLRGFRYVAHNDRGGGAAEVIVEARTNVRLVRERQNVTRALPPAADRECGRRQLGHDCGRHTLRYRAERRPRE